MISEISRLHLMFRDLSDQPDGDDAFGDTNDSELDEDLDAEGGELDEDEEDEETSEEE